MTKDRQLTGWYTLDPADHEYWYTFSAPDRTTHYGFGTTDEARRYARHLNEGLDADRYGFEMTYEVLAHALSFPAWESGLGVKVDLLDALNGIEEAP
jgi:hypothetical protein